MDSSHDGLINPLRARGQRMSVSRLAVISSGQAPCLSVHHPPPLPPHVPSASCPALWLKSPLSCSCPLTQKILPQSFAVTYPPLKVASKRQVTHCSRHRICIVLQDEKAVTPFLGKPQVARQCLISLNSGITFFVCQIISEKMFD